MTDYEGLVREFHVKFNHYLGNIKNFPPAEVVELRRKLIAEEAIEFNEATEAFDIIKVADSLADLLYVVFGAALAFGVPIDKVFEEVHRSNMTKSMAKDEKSIKGKTLKGPDYVPPDLIKILRRKGGVGTRLR